MSIDFSCPRVASVIFVPEIRKCPVISNFVVIFFEVLNKYFTSKSF